MEQTTCLVTGAAGFIGSHLIDRLLGLGYRVIGVDNYRLGRRSNLALAESRGEFSLIEGDVNDYAGLLAQVAPMQVSGRIGMVWHLAANSDIRAGVADPRVDFDHTFRTTVSVLELMRALGIRRLAFASSSAIWGRLDRVLEEDSGPCFPISNYGAMKLASEGAISSALEAQLDRAWIFRFPNVVGGRATHGVVYDFVGRLRENPGVLEVLGDGRQEKPYLHVGELVEAMLFAAGKSEGRMGCFNIGPEGPGTTVAQIAEWVVAAMAPGAAIRYTGGAQGWVGDVPRFRYSTERLARLGWRPQLSSDAAVRRAVEEVVREQLG
jgi:UDP-glucose 4-epimerase